VTWATTSAFLEHFGLENATALPGIEELRAAGLLDARAGISTLATQASADGRGVPPDEEDEDERAAAEELHGEPIAAEGAEGEAADDDYESELLQKHGEGEERAEAESHAEDSSDDDQVDGDDEDADDDDDAGDDEDYGDDDDDDDGDDDDDDNEDVEDSLEDEPSDEEPSDDKKVAERGE
jgi:segregation and condensation protein B